MSRMGDLANAFDVPDEQSTNVGWANRLGEILTARPQYDETVQYKTASPLVTITEGDIGRATEAAMGVSGGGMKLETPKGIKAYHSSPHDFDKFDLAKIGTGEGAQVYGHGLYFAESPAVSGQGGEYWKQFQRKFSGDELAASIALKQSNFDRDAAIAAARADLDYMRQRQTGLVHPGANREGLAGMIAGAERELALLESRKPVGPRTYEVNINADPAHMLDWDKPLREMSPEVQRAAGRLVERDIPNEPGWGKTTGEQFHTAVGERVGRKPDVAAALREAGIPGIKYLDQGSRMPGPSALTTQQLQDRLNTMRADLASGRGSQSFLERQISSIENELERFHQKPTSNYVIFDPNIIRIDKKYAVPGAIGAGGMGALAAQDEYSQ